MLSTRQELGRGVRVGLFAEPLDAASRTMLDIAVSGFGAGRRDADGNEARGRFRQGKGLDDRTPKCVGWPNQMVCRHDSDEEILARMAMSEVRHAPNQSTKCVAATRLSEDVFGRNISSGRNWRS